MPTLSEHAKLANDVLLEGLYINILTTSELAPWLQFMTFEGNSLLYNRESTLPTTSFNTVGGTWTDTEPTFSQKTANLKIIGVQSPLDRYVMTTRSNVNDQKAVLFTTMGKSLARKIEQYMIIGEPEATATEFEGIDSLLRADTRMMAMDDGVIDGPGTAETELTLDRLDAMIDMVEGGLPTILLMNKTVRRKLTSLCRATDSSGIMVPSMDEFGRQVYRYNTIPIVISDYITNAQQYNDASTWPSSTATSIYALKFGEEQQGITTIHNGEVLTPDFQDIGIKTDKNENLYRLVVYLENLLFSPKMVAGLGGIDSTA